ncbi:MAG: cytochrome C [Chlorobi bacterium]|nr:cytochrome C [Chlorobiota bacterium]
MKLPKSYYNTLSYIGTLVAGLSLLLIIFLFMITYFFHVGSSYIGLFLYIIIPSLLVLGLIIIPVGMFFERRRNRLEEKGKIKKSKLIIDLNNYRHRNAVFIFTLGTIVFIFLTGIGSYEAFHITESVKFCGTTCHTVMKPEYTAYQNSPHANVTCVECHVGEGADWYVKSKLSGLYQVYSVIFKKYPKPIPTPVHSLRPARETCEKCHWPKKFYSNLLVSERHYLADKNNTEWDINLRMKIGPNHSANGFTEGIHWHINKNVKIEYITNKEDRSSIPWVRYINKVTNDTVLFENTESPLKEKEIEESDLKTREMDCMDCHNRPSHVYSAPQDFVDEAISAGLISRDIPKIKARAMKVLNKKYSTQDSAIMIITEKLNSYYSKKYPEIYNDSAQLVQKAIVAITDEYKKNVFPEMNASWDAYPNFIGHKEYDGCFRCHSGSHKSSDGQTISKDCNLCHTILKQGSNAENMEVADIDSSLTFKHPEDIDGEWKETNCSECHRELY